LKDTGGVCRAQMRQHRYRWIKYAAVTDIWESSNSRNASFIFYIYT